MPVDIPFGVLVASSMGLALLIAWVIGANDAANSVATSVGGRILSLKKAMLFFSVFTFLGAVTQGYRVMKTLGKGIVPIEFLNPLAVFAAVLAIFIWVYFCTWKGIPVSTSHSAVGGVLGVGLVVAGIANINWKIMASVVLSWVLSPLLAMSFALIIYKTLDYIISRKLRENVSNYERQIRLLQIGVLCFTAYSFGANDVANAVGVISAILGGQQIWIIGSTIWLAALGAGGIIIGGLTYGRRVILTIGSRITTLNPLSGFIAQFSMAITVLLFTIVPHILWGYGMPISTTHSIVGAVIGVGLAKGIKAVDRTVTTYIVFSWLLTVPCAAGIATVIYLILTIIGVA